MPDAIFAHPRLAAIYDAFDGERDDLAAYVGIADELAARRVLDVGCGTGSLAILLAGTGRTVVGVDPAEASLEVARAKNGSAAVTRSRRAWSPSAIGCWTYERPPTARGVRSCSSPGVWVLSDLSDEMVPALHKRRIGSLVS